MYVSKAISALATCVRRRQIPCYHEQLSLQKLRRIKLQVYICEKMCFSSEEYWDICPFLSIRYLRRSEVKMKSEKPMKIRRKDGNYHSGNTAILTLSPWRSPIIFCSSRAEC